MSLQILWAAEDWGVPPWVISGEDPTNEVRSEWLAIRIYSKPYEAKYMEKLTNG